MMDTQQLEKQFQMWQHFMYMVLGAALTFASTGLGNIVYGTDWPGFGNYAGGMWSSLQFLSTLPGFYLLLGGRWKPIPLFNRINTILGYFVASWLSLLSLGLIMETPPATDYYFLLAGNAILIILGYIWSLKKTSIPREEIFP